MGNENMQIITTKGQCSTCKTVVSNKAARQHLEKCTLLTKKGNNSCYLIRVHGDAKVFWVYIAIPLKCTLAELDSFLRKLWLECCGHLSSFNIAGVTYEDCMEASYGECDEKSSDIRIAAEKILRSGITFTYKY